MDDLDCDACKKEEISCNSLYSKVLITVQRLMVSDRKNRNGVKVDAVYQCMDENYYINGDLYGQVLSSLEKAVRQGFLFKKKKHYILLSPAANLIKFEPDLKEIERVESIFYSGYSGFARGGRSRTVSRDRSRRRTKSRSRARNVESISDFAPFTNCKDSQCKREKSKPRSRSRSRSRGRGRSRSRGRSRCRSRSKTVMRDDLGDDCSSSDNKPKECFSLETGNVCNKVPFCPNKDTCETKK